MKSKKIFLVLILIVGLASIVLILFPDRPVVTAPTPSPSPAEIVSAPTNVWFSLLEQTPLPYNTPLPDAVWTPIDGTYALLDPSQPQWWSCRRCADYRPAGGIWRLQFSKGVMRIYYNVTGWANLASYTVSGDRLYIFNDPVCKDDVGEYRWTLEDKWGLADRTLTLQVIDDPCAVGLRGENLGTQAWNSCMPPNEMTGASGHWHKPVGCELELPPEENVPTPENLTVIVQPGDARQFEKTPEMYAHANSDVSPPPEGINVSYHADSIPYGVTRVLWGENIWVEATTSLPFSAIGVQFLGDYTIGWARVLFDGVEVWRGDTSTIWSKERYFGGYVEITDFSPGEHTIRAESLGFDYHPVTVAFFGFNLDGKTEIVSP